MENLKAVVVNLSQVFLKAKSFSMKMRRCRKGLQNPEVFDLIVIVTQQGIILTG